MKGSRKFGKYILYLLLLALLGGSIYLTWDYTQNPDKYDSFIARLKDRMEGGDQVQMEEVSPTRDVTFSRTIEETGLPYHPYRCSPYEFYGNEDPLILCYGKDIGGDLPVPTVRIADADLKFKRLQLQKPDGSLVDLTDLVIPQHENSCFLVREAAFSELPAGDYFLLADYDSAEGILRSSSYALQITEETTYNSSQRGLLEIADKGNWIINDLENPRDITFTFINLGDNPVRGVFLGSRLLTPEECEINKRGDQVTLKKEYLSTLRPNNMLVYKFRLASGEILQMEDMLLGSFRGDTVPQVTFQASETYSHSAGGDYQLTITPDSKSRLILVKLEDFGSDRGGPIFEEHMAKDAGSPHFNLDTMTITIPEEEMQVLAVQKAPYCVTVGFLFQDTFWGQDNFLFRVVP